MRNNLKGNHYALGDNSAHLHRPEFDGQVGDKDNLP